MLVVAYGLFHGLIFFPVLLSLVGPAPFMIHSETEVAISAEELEPQLNQDKSKTQEPALTEEQVPIKKEDTVLYNTFNCSFI